MATIDTSSTAVPRANIGLLAGVGTIIFTANFGLLVLQLIGGRYLAPFIGSSIETWTSVIGIFLGGIALGNWIGGKIADRYPTPKTLAILLILGGLASLTMMFGYNFCKDSGFYKTIPLGSRIPLLAAMFCLLPATVLSMITPVVIRLAMSDVRRAGRVAGLSFALSTLGCLLGNYLTGFWLMAEYTLDTICIGTAALLGALGIGQFFLASSMRQKDPVAAVPDHVPREIPLARETSDEDSGMKGNMRAAFAIVFVCSFCGMSLELTGVRVLAPTLGVSLYTWTGIIGVMLAGTAFGNYFGGVMADRGPGAAFKGISILFLGLIGVAAAFSVGREFKWLPPSSKMVALIVEETKEAATLRTEMFDNKELAAAMKYAGHDWRVVEKDVTDEDGNPPAEIIHFLEDAKGKSLPYLYLVDEGGTTRYSGDARNLTAAGLIEIFNNNGPPNAFLVHLLGLICGIAIAVLGIQNSRMRFGGFFNLLMVGGAIGAMAIYPTAKQFCRLLSDATEDKWKIWQATMKAWSNKAGHDLEPWIMHGGGFLIGVLMVLLLYGWPNPGDDRPRRRMSLSFCIFAASLATIMVVIAIGILEASTFMYQHENIVEKVLVWTFALFFLPMFSLGMVSPQVIRLTVPDLKHAGRTAGSIYAVSTLGAIVGTFVTGYFLIGAVGSFRVLMLISLILAIVCFLVGKLWQSNVMLFGFSLIVGAAVIGMIIFGYKTDVYDMDTKYYAIVVRDRMYEDKWVKTLTLDHLLHSYVDPDDPTWLGYPHEYVQEELIRLASANHDHANLLIVGGGGYTFPRCIDQELPNVDIDVVEIDPGVTEIAYKKLGLSSRHIETGLLVGGSGSYYSDFWQLRRPTRITTHNMDGRQFVAEKAKKGNYHLVVQDAVNDLSIPYHLLTKEYNDAINDLLAPDGVYLLTFIDKLEDGKLWKAAARTMKQTFKYVHLLGSDHVWTWNKRAVYVLYGSNKPLDLPQLREALAKQGKAKMTDANWLLFGGGAHFLASRTNQVDDELLEKWLLIGDKIMLTDQYAPVDNLMSDIFAESNRKR